MTKPTLDALIARAREIDVRRAHADEYSRELARWARPVGAPRRWGPAFGGLVVAFAAVATIILIVRTPSRAVQSDDPIQLGERVAVLSEPGTSYRVMQTDAARTEVVVDRGTVTARLFQGVASHELALSGGGVAATASAAVMSLAVGDQGGVITVHQGAAAVSRGREQRTVHAGDVWPPGSRGGGTRAAGRLLALAQPTVETVEKPPEPTTVPVDVPPIIDAGVVVDSPPRVRVPSAVAGDAAVPDTTTLAARWRTARLYRSQAKFDDAVTECLGIADAHDSTWSPIALVEAARIELGPRASPEHAVSLVDRFEREWPGHSLAPEARELRCRALRELGRGSECAPAATP